MKTLKLILAGVVACIAFTGCAGQKTANDQNASTVSTSPTPGARIVKSKDGTFDGEIIGTAQPDSKFSKLEIGMMMSEVSGLIGAPDNLSQHETGKRWIPFYFGPDVKRIEVVYKGEGCLTYTGGNQFGAGGNKLIRISVDPNGACFQS